MNRRVVNYIISLLLAFAFMSPIFFRSDVATPLPLNDRSVLSTVVRGIPLLAVLLLASLSGSVQERRKRGWLTPSRYDVLPAVLLFFITASAGYLLPPDQPRFSMELSSAWAPVLIPLLALYSAAGEELFFRSWLISSLEDLGGNGWPAVIISASLFGIMHIWQGGSALILATAAGLIYGMMFRFRRNLTPLIAAHTAHNILALVLASR